MGETYFKANNGGIRNLTFSIKHGATLGIINVLIRTGPGLVVGITVVDSGIPMNPKGGGVNLLFGQNLPKTA